MSSNTITAFIVGRGKAFRCSACGKPVPFRGKGYRWVTVDGPQFCCPKHAVDYYAGLGRAAHRELKRAVDADIAAGKVDS